MSDKAEATYHGATEEQRLFNEARQRLISTLPGGIEEYMNNPVVHAQIMLFSQTVSTFNTLMEREGVDAAARRRVVNGVLFGSPDGYDVHQAQREMAQLVGPSLTKAQLEDLGIVD